MPGEKTEQPSEKKLRDARKKGQVAKSNDLTQAVLFLAAAGALSFGGPYFVTELQSLLRESLRPEMLSGDIESGPMVEYFGQAALRGLMLCLPVMGVLAILGWSVNFFQTKGLFAPEVVKPKFDKLNPMEGFKNLFFKAKTYIELLKNLVKLAVIFAMVYYTLKSEVRDVVLTARVAPADAALFAAGLASKLFLRIGVACLVLGAADFLIQKRLHLKQMMMSKEEVKQEYKEMEGDPHIKHARRHLHQELLASASMQSVPKAAVVVVNPTHLAIALEYRESTMTAPLIGAKGRNKAAERILDIARQHRIPIMQNIPLAHKLIEVEVGEEIPEDLYEAVAEVLNWVYSLAEEENASR